MKTIIYLLFISCLIAGCKSPQKVTESSSAEQHEKINMDVSFLESQNWKELINRYIATTSTDHTIMSICKIVYDTDKPVDPNTGTHPIAEKLDMEITKEKKTGTTDSIISELQAKKETELTDQSIIKSDNLVLDETTGITFPVNGQMLLIVALALICVVMLLFKAIKP